MSDKPTAFGDLPADAYPFSMTFVRADNHEDIETIRVAEAPVVVEIPPVAKRIGVPVYVRMRFANTAQPEFSSMPCCGGFNGRHVRGCRYFDAAHDLFIGQR